jgi:ribonuclease P protein component
MRAGVRTKSGPVTVIRLATDLDHPRLGIVAGRRLGNAVTRNRVKRRIRAAAAEANLDPASDYVIVPTAAAATIPFEDLVVAIAAAARTDGRQT